MKTGHAPSLWVLKQSYAGIMEYSALMRPLDRLEFAAALSKGQGRAMLHVIHYGFNDIKNLVLEACIHNQVYDQQLESSRAEWLFEIIKDSQHFQDFRNAVLKAIETEVDFWNKFQLCRLLKEIAVNDDEEARRTLREFVCRNAANPESEGDWLGVEE